MSLIPIRRCATPKPETNPRTNGLPASMLTEQALQKGGALVRRAFEALDDLPERGRERSFGIVLKKHDLFRCVPNGPYSEAVLPDREDY